MEISIWTREAIFLAFISLAVSEFIRSLACSDSVMKVGHTQQDDRTIDWPSHVLWLYYTGIGVLFVLIHQLMGWPINMGWMGRLSVAHSIQQLGCGLLLTGTSIALWARWTMRSAFQQPGLPPLPTTSLVVAGPFRWSRNPNYLAYMIMWIGTQCLLLSEAVLLVVILWGLFRCYISREERVLRERYGAQFVDYCRRTPRFL